MSATITGQRCPAFGPHDATQRSPRPIWQRNWVAVGSVNWYLKRLIARFVKVTHLQRRRLRYLITPQGISEKARLTLSFMEVSLQVYRQIRQQSRGLLAQVRMRGYQRVRVLGDGDVAEIIRLTCLEQETGVADGDAGGPYPAVVVSGDRLSLDWPGTEN